MAVDYHAAAVRLSTINASHKQASRIATALRAAERRGRADAKRQALKVANAELRLCVRAAKKTEPRHYLGGASAAKSISDGIKGILTR